MLRHFDIMVSMSFCVYVQILMMVVPFLLIMVVPKLINTQDPETQKVTSVEILYCSK